MTPLTNYFRSWLSYLQEDLRLDFFTELESAEQVGTGDDSFVPQIIILITLTLITVLVLLHCTSQTLQISPFNDHSTLQLYALLLATFWITGALSLTRWSWWVFLYLFCCMVVISASFGWMAWAQKLGVQQPIPFWCSIGFWTVFAVTGTWNIETGWDRFICVLGTLLMVLVTIITICDYAGIKSATKANYDVQQIHILLDIRYLLGIFFGVTILGEATIRAWKKGLPDVTEIPDLTVASPSYRSYWARVIANQFFVVSNTVLRFARSLLNSAWLSIAIPIKYFVQVGIMTIDIIDENVARRETLTWYATLVCSFFLLFLLNYSALTSADVIHSYLDNRLSTGAFLQALYLILTISAGSICVIALTWLFEKEHRALAMEGPLSSLMILLATFFVSGLFMYPLAQIDILKIHQFQRVGPFTVAIFIFIGMGLAYRMYTYVLSGRTEPTN